MKHMKCSVLSMTNGLMAYWEEIEKAAVYHDPPQQRRRGAKPAEPAEPAADREV